MLSVSPQASVPDPLYLGPLLPAPAHYFWNEPIIGNPLPWEGNDDWQSLPPRISLPPTINWHSTPTPSPNDQVSITLVATDLQGNVLDAVRPGESFVLHEYAQDVGRHYYN